jgi:hypothetical protein
MFDPYSQETEQYVEDLKSGSNNMLVGFDLKPTLGSSALQATQ